MHVDHKRLLICKLRCGMFDLEVDTDGKSSVSALCSPQACSKLRLTRSIRVEPKDRNDGAEEMGMRSGR